MFAIDLTLDEVKELYAVQTFRFRDHSYDARYRCACPSVVRQVESSVHTSKQAVKLTFVQVKACDGLGTLQLRALAVVLFIEQQRHSAGCRCRVPTLKEVLVLVNAAQRAGKTVGVAIHTLVRCAAATQGSCAQSRPGTWEARKAPRARDRAARQHEPQAPLQGLLHLPKACRAPAVAAVVQSQRHR